MAAGSSTDRQIPTWLDNRPGNSTLDAVRQLLTRAKKVDIATGYFEIGALLDLDGHWQGACPIRLLMGDEVTRRTRTEIVEALKELERNGIERKQQEEDWQTLEGLEAFKEALQNGAIEARVYTRAKFHAKAIHFHTDDISHHGIVGSSNFTHPGLTQNIELNHFTSDKSHLDKLAKWYEAART